MSDTMTTPAASAEFQPGDMVYATNNDDKDVIFTWNSRKFVLTPGRKTPITIEAVINHLGDPRSSGNIASYVTAGKETGWVPDRLSEVRRLRNKYGNVFGDETVINNTPSVTIEDLEGNRIYTVVDDPDGTKSSPSSNRTHEDTAQDLKLIIDRQQEQINRLMKLAGTDANMGTTEDQLPRDEGKGTDATTVNPDDIFGDNDTPSISTDGTVNFPSLSDPDDDGTLPPSDDS